MATKKKIVSQDEKFEKQDLDLFEVLNALDRKDYNYYSNLTQEQQKKVVPYVLVLWMSAIKGNKTLQTYYLMNADYSANKYLFNENIQKHPELQWLMLCAVSPNVGKQYHQWIPHIRERVSKLKEPAKSKDIKDYFSKVNPSLNGSELDEVTESFIKENKRKIYLSETFPLLKIEDIETLSKIITDADIEEYEKERGF